MDRQHRQDKSMVFRQGENLPGYLNFIFQGQNIEIVKNLCILALHLLQVVLS